MGYLAKGLFIKNPLPIAFSLLFTMLNSFSTDILIVRFTGNFFKFLGSYKGFLDMQVFLV